MIKKLAAMVTLAAVSQFGVAIAGVPAQADDDPYTAGVRTSCNISVPDVVKRGTAPTIRANVRPNGPAQGTGPRGDVRVTIAKSGSRVFTKTVPYRGSAVEIQGPTLNQPGRYQARAEFTTADGSVFKSCSGSAAFNVRAGLGPNQEGPGPGPNAGTGGPGGLLPDTGGPHLLWLLLGLLLVGSGFGLVVAGRRHPTLYPV